MRLKTFVCHSLMLAQFTCGLPSFSQGLLWDAYIRSGNEFYLHGNYVKAEERFLRAYDEAQKSGYQDLNLAATLNNLGEVHRKLGKYDLAEKELTKALNIKDQLQADMRSRLRTLESLVDVFQDQAKMDDAVPLLVEAVRLRELIEGRDSVDMAYDLHRLGKISSDLQHYHKAESFYRHALKIRLSKTGRRSLETAETLADLGLCVASLKRTSEAITYLKAALSIRKQYFSSKSTEVSRLEIQISSLSKRTLIASKQTTSKNTKKTTSKGGTTVNSSQTVAVGSPRGNSTESANVDNGNSKDSTARTTSGNSNIADSTEYKSFSKESSPEVSQGPRQENFGKEVQPDDPGKSSKIVEFSDFQKYALERISDDNFHAAMQAELAGDLLQAEKMFLASLRAAKEGKNEDKVDLIRSTLGNFYFARNNLNEAENQFELALRSDDLRVRRECLVGLAESNFGEGLTEKANGFYKRALTAFGTKPHGADYSLVQLKFANALILQQEVCESERILRSLIDEGHRVCEPHLAEAFRLLGKIELEKGNADAGKKYLQRSDSISRSSLAFADVSRNQTVSVLHDRLLSGCGSTFQKGRLVKTLDVNGVVTCTSVRQASELICVMIDITNGSDKSIFVFPVPAKFKILKPEVAPASFVSNEEVATQIEKSASEEAGARSRQNSNYWRSANRAAWFGNGAYSSTNDDSDLNIFLQESSKKANRIRNTSTTPSTLLPGERKRAYAYFRSAKWSKAELTVSIGNGDLIFPIDAL